MYVLFTEKDYMGNGERKFIGKSETMQGAKQIRTRYWNKNGFVDIQCADMNSEHGEISYPHVKLVDLQNGVYSNFVFPKHSVPLNYNKKKGV